MLRPLRAGEASKPLTEILRSEDSVVQAPALTLHPRYLAGPEQTQQDGEENQAVVKPEHHRQGEHLEERDENDEEERKTGQAMQSTGNRFNSQQPPQLQSQQVG